MNEKKLRKAIDHIAQEAVDTLAFPELYGPREIVEYVASMAEKALTEAGDTTEMEQLLLWLDKEVQGIEHPRREPTREEHFGFWWHGYIEGIKEIIDQIDEQFGCRLDNE